jgi:hypothetical protein
MADKSICCVNLARNASSQNLLEFWIKLWVNRDIFRSCVFRLLPYAVAVHTSRNLRHIDVGGYLALLSIELIEKIGNPCLNLAVLM